VISFTKEAYEVYKNGFKKPNVDLPAAARKELTNATIPAITGEEAEVPPTYYA
jgi:hypothetical protein